MSIWNLLTNTIEGTLQAGVNVGKAVVGVVVAPVDGGETLTEAEEGLRDGMEKIGKSE